MNTFFIYLYIFFYHDISNCIIDEPHNKKSKPSTSSSATEVRQVDNNQQPEDNRTSTPVTASCSTSQCCQHIPNNQLHTHQRTEQHRSQTSTPSHLKDCFVIETAFKNRIVSYRIPCLYQTLDYGDFMVSVKEKVTSLVHFYLQKYTTLKIGLELFGNYFLKTTGEFTVKSFICKFKVVTISTNFNEMYEEFMENLITKATEFNENKSGMNYFPKYISLQR